MPKYENPAMIRSKMVPVHVTADFQKDLEACAAKLGLTVSTMMKQWAEQAIQAARAA